MYNFDNYDENKLIRIQKWYRGCSLRMKRLPLIMYRLQSILRNTRLSFSYQNDDGRINSSIDEIEVIRVLCETMKRDIKKAKHRMWYDILVFDKRCGWLPVNIKTTTMTTSDNVGNLAMCVYSYTNYDLNIHSDKTYQNGEMSNILFKSLRDKRYNMSYGRDYYFLVLNKNDNMDIVVNSVKGLTILTPNINNLPYQVKWHKNRMFNYRNIEI